MGTFYNTDTLSGMTFLPIQTCPIYGRSYLDNRGLLESQYDVIAGKWPENYDELVLIVDKNNEISELSLYSLGLKDRSELDEIIKASLNGEEIKTRVQSWSYDELLGKTFKLVLPTDCYQYDKEARQWKDMTGNESYMRYIVDNGLELKIVGIIRPNKDAAANAMSGAVGIQASCRNIA
jgi:putative ABC transport system permease protein